MFSNHSKIDNYFLKAHTKTPIFTGSLLAPADPNTKSADSGTDFIISVRQRMSNMFDILTLTGSTDGKWLTICEPTRRKGTPCRIW